MSFQDLEAGRPVRWLRRGLVNGKQGSTQAVASGIFHINTAVSTFQRLVNTLGTPKDTPELREKLHKTRLHIGQLVKDTSAKLKQASETDHRAEVSASQKIADAKLAKDFQAVLKEFQKAQWLAAERETAYNPFVPQTVLSSSYTAREVDVSSDKNVEQRALLVESRRCCMESLPHVQFYSYCNLAILLMLFAGFGIQVGRCEPYSNFNNNINVFCSSKNYVMTTYFQNYENLLDSNFQDFIAHELQTGLCEVLPDNSNLVIRQSVLQRHLIGKGYHRHLSSSIRLHIDPEPFSQLPFRQCEVIVVERLPSGVFADPFELQHLHSHGVFTDVAVFGDTNLELPSFRSNRSAVEIHMNVGSDIFLRQKNGLEFKVQLPLHARYQPLDETGHSRVEFGDPDLFMRCCKEGKLQNRSCLFISTSNNFEPKTVHAVWRIPSGIKAHAGVVSVVTFISAFLSTILIVLTSIFCSVKSLKQS